MKSALLVISLLGPVLAFSSALLATVSRIETEAPLHYLVKAPGLSVLLNEQGRIVDCSPLKVTGHT